MKQEYPKVLYGKDGFKNINDCVTVNDKDEEAIVREGGYTDLSKPEEAAELAAKAEKEAAELAAKSKK